MRGDTPIPPRVVPRPEGSEEDLIGLRDDDMDRQERRRLVATLSTNRGARDRARAMTLARELRSLPPPPTDLHPGHVLSELAHRKRRRRRRWALGGLAGGALALAAILPVMTSLGTPAARTMDHVSIEANATLGPRALPVWGRAEIPSEASLELVVSTTGPGALFVLERWGYNTVVPLTPATGRWEVEAGEHTLPGLVSPAHVPLDVRYEAWLCPAGTLTPTVLRCRSDKIEVSWR